jgi:hypothetical protein
MSTPPVGHSNSMIPTPTGIRSPMGGTVTAVAVGILAGYSASRFGNFGRLSSVVIGGLTCFFTKVIHEMLTKVELGMPTAEFRDRLDTEVSSVCASAGMHGEEHQATINGYVNRIFEKLSTTITELDKGYKKIRWGVSSGLILPSGNWNRLTITLVMNTKKSIIKVGVYNAYYNRIEIDIPTQKFKLDGVASKALGITEM